MSDPLHHGLWILDLGNALQHIANRGPLSTTIPDFRLSTMDSDPSACPQLFLHVAYTTPTRSGMVTMKTSSWNVKRCSPGNNCALASSNAVLSDSEEQWHECVTLFSTFTSGDLHCATRILSRGILKVLRRTRAQMAVRCFHLQPA